jgi:soluble lytic murein transglycosylase-like protein
MTTEEIQNLVIDSAQACGLDPTVAFYQIQRESGFNPNARGADGEKGIAQFMEGTWARFGEGSHDNAFDPAKSMAAYCRYMTYLLGLFNDYEKALEGYNGGEGNVQKGTVSARARSYASEILSQARYTQNNIGPIVVTGGQPGQSGLPTWLMLGFAALLVWVVVSD